MKVFYFKNFLHDGRSTKPFHILFLVKKKNLKTKEKISSFVVILNMKFYYSISRSLPSFFRHLFFVWFRHSWRTGVFFFTWRTFLLKSVFKKKGTFLPFCLSAATPPLWRVTVGIQEIARPMHANVIKKKNQLYLRQKKRSKKGVLKKMRWKDES